MKMQAKTKKALTYLIAIAIPLAVGGVSALVNAGKLDGAGLVNPPLSPPTWLFPIVWTILFFLMGISAARVYRSECAGRNDALFLWGVQLAVVFLWTVFYFSFRALALSFFWLIFLILLVGLMAVRFSRCAAGAGKLQIPYLIWLCFAAYLNLASWLLNR